MDGEMSAMSWHKITLPMKTEIDPDVVEIGKLGWACYDRENKPEGFAMFHAARGVEGENGRFLVYLSPVATKLCPEILETYTAEPCEVPYRDEQDIAFVLGDPRVMGELREGYVAEGATEEAQAAS
jgi:hypothetical protein